MAGRYAGAGCGLDKKVIMSQKISIITGASTGIGYALAQRLAASGHSVLAIARRQSDLEALRHSSSLIEVCSADISSEPDQKAIVQAVNGRPVEYLIHNAGVIEPIGPLLDQPAAAIRKNLDINVQAPLALSAAIWPYFIDQARIMHISSGAAHRALPGWGAYCMSKAALFMAYEVLKAELIDRTVAIGSLRPGVVDTPMQDLIRGQSEKDFPPVESFRALKEQGQLTSPSEVAQFIEAVLEKPSAREFSAQEWDIREHWEAMCAQ